MLHPDYGYGEMNCKNCLYISTYEGYRGLDINDKFKVKICSYKENGEALYYKARTDPIKNPEYQCCEHFRLCMKNY